MRRSILPLVWLLWFSGTDVLGQEARLRNQPGLSLGEAFEVYVRNVQRSDLEGLFTTVTAGDGLFFLTATGEKIDGGEGYRSFHRDWFAESGWDMPVELLRMEERGDLGYTLAMFRFRQVMPDGNTYHSDSYFTLLCAIFIFFCSVFVYCDSEAPYDSNAIANAV